MKPALLLAPLVLFALPLAAATPTPAGSSKPATSKPAGAKPAGAKPSAARPGAARPGTKPTAGPALPGAAPAAVAGPPFAIAQLRLADGTPGGIARFRPRGDHIVLEIALAGIPQGVHGIHLHAVGKCDAPAFATAGPHLNPLGHQHGMDNPMGSHLGDLPNLTADANGRVGARFGLNQDAAALSRALFDADGTAIVLHAGEDDYRTDPAGNSGARIACGVLLAPGPVAGPEIGR